MIVKPLSNFLCCFDLETGGLVIGWLGVVFNGIATTLSTTAFMIGMLECGQNESCFEVMGILVFIATSIGCFDIFNSLLAGIETRNHKKVMPTLILFLIKSLLLAIVFTVGIVLHDIKGCIVSTVLLIINSYCSLVLYAIYVKFKNAHERTDSRETFLEGV